MLSHPTAKPLLENAQERGTELETMQQNIKRPSEETSRWLWRAWKYKTVHKFKLSHATLQVPTYHHRYSHDNYRVLKSGHND
jgi:hypothetical protein